MYSKEVLKETEEIIKEYYKKLKMLEFYKKRIESLNNIYKELPCEWQLNNHIGSLKYDKPKVKGGKLPISPMDIEIEHIKTPDEIQDKIRENKKLVAILSCEISLINDIVNSLSEDNKNLLELIYKKNKSYESIALELKETKGNICKRNKTILGYISQYLYLEIKRKCLGNETETNWKRNGNV